MGEPVTAEEYAWLCRPWGFDGSLKAETVRGHLGGRVYHLRRAEGDHEALCGAKPKPGSRWRSDVSRKRAHNTCYEILKRGTP